MSTHYQELLPAYTAPQNPPAYSPPQPYCRPQSLRSRFAFFRSKRAYTPSAEHVQHELAEQHRAAIRRISAACKMSQTMSKSRPQTRWRRDLAPAGLEKLCWKPYCCMDGMVADH